MKTPYTQSYNLTLQYQLSPSQTVQAAYVGNGVRHLGVYINPNSPDRILPPGLNSFDFSPYPDFPTSFTYSSFAGNSYYHSLQLAGSAPAYKFSPTSRGPSAARMLLTC